LNRESQGNVQAGVWKGLNCTTLHHYITTAITMLKPRLLSWPWVCPRCPLKLCCS